MKKNTFLTIVILLSIIAVGGYWYTAKNTDNKSQVSQTETNRLEVERNIKIPDGETRKFVFTKELVAISMTDSESIDDVIEDIAGDEENRNCEKIINNGDGTVSLWLTNRQLDEWMSGIEVAFNDCISESEKKGINIEINSEMTDITYKITKENKMMLEVWGMYAANFESLLLETQVFKGKKIEDIHVRMQVIHENTGRVIVDATIPGADYQITEQQWNEGLADDFGEDTEE